MGVYSVCLCICVSVSSQYTYYCNLFGSFQCNVSPESKPQIPCNTHAQIARQLVEKMFFLPADISDQRVCDCGGVCAFAPMLATKEIPYKIRTENIRSNRGPAVSLLSATNAISVYRDVVLFVVSQSGNLPQYVVFLSATLAHHISDSSRALVLVLAVWMVRFFLDLYWDFFFAHNFERYFEVIFYADNRNFVQNMHCPVVL